MRGCSISLFHPQPALLDGAASKSASRARQALELGEHINESRGLARADSFSIERRDDITHRFKC